MARVAAMQLLLGALGIYYLKQTIDETRKTLRQAQYAATAATRESTRAHLIVRSKNRELIATNLGRTPALALDIYIYRPATDDVTPEPTLAERKLLLKVRRRAVRDDGRDAPRHR